jgi:hypothetical protein
MSTIIYEPTNKIDVITPKGKGSIWLVTDYGYETDTIYTVIQDNGELWSWTHKDLKISQNITFGRKDERPK